MNRDWIFWRHAEAEDLSDSEDHGGQDLSRHLTRKGEKHAARMGVWLQHHLPENTQIWSSPAVRTEQTVLALGRPYRLHDALRPEADWQTVWDWLCHPGVDQTAPVLCVGHQPMLGQLVARLLGLREERCAIKKGAVWWLRQREREGQSETVLVTVQTPEYR